MHCKHSGDWIAFALLPVLLLAACRGPSSAARPAADNPEVTRLCAEDQADRTPGNGQPIDWKLVGPRDAERLARVKELYRAGVLRSGLDFHHAALLLQHGTEPDDYVLAHELCIVAIAKGDSDALVRVGEGVTDDLRSDFQAPSLAEAQQREALMNSLPGHKQ